MKTVEELEKELADYVASLPEDVRKRMEAIQWRCDQVRAKYGDNHVGCMVELSKMMMQSVGELNDALNNAATEKTKADVLEFKAKDKDE